tara:strand:- start:324 stop:674 length:351 start_codon:yes stop_codon:yes gene_type:complete
MDFNNLPCDIKQLIFHQNRVDKVEKKYRNVFSNGVLSELTTMYKKPARWVPEQDCHSVLKRLRNAKWNYPNVYDGRWVRKYTTSSERFNSDEWVKEERWQLFDVSEFIVSDSSDDE